MKSAGKCSAAQDSTLSSEHEFYIGNGRLNEFLLFFSAVFIKYG